MFSTSTWLPHDGPSKLLLQCFSFTIHSAADATTAAAAVAAKEDGDTSTQRNTDKENH